MQFAVSYPDFMDGIFRIGGGAIDGTQGFFFGPLTVSILESCAGWDRGNYDENPKQCASNALSVFDSLHLHPGMVGPVHRHARGLHEVAQRLGGLLPRHSGCAGSLLSNDGGGERLGR